MDEDRAEIVRRLARIEERLDRLDRASGFLDPLPTPAPPPILVTPAPPERERESAKLPRWEPVPEPDARRPTRAAFGAPAVAKAAAPDLEYQIGARVLPVVAALFILGAIGFLVSLGFSRGLITPPMLFGGVCAGCLAFIGVGLAKQEEREQFGQILIGIGSCGLYLNFAAGHVFQHLYEGELLVGLFVGLSMVNLAYAWWRASQAFLAIGLIGGFAASLMPLDEGKVNLSLGLHFLILVPVALLCHRHRWKAAMDLGYGASYLCLLLTFHDGRLPFGISSTPSPMLAPCFGVAAVMAAVVHALIEARGEDPPALQVPRSLRAREAVPGLIVVGGITAFSIETPSTGGWIALGIGLVVAFFGSALSRRLVSAPFYVAASIMAFLVAPLGLPDAWSLWVCTALALVLPLLGLRYVRLAGGALWLGMGDFVLAVIGYLGIASSRTPLVWYLDAATVTGLLLAVLSQATLLDRQRSALGSLGFGTYLLVLPLFLRFSYLLIRPGLGASGELAFAIGLATYAAVGAVVTLRRGEMTVLGTAWVLVTAGAVAFLFAAGDTYLQDGTWASVAPGSGLPFRVEWPLLTYFALVVGLLGRVGQSVSAEKDRSFHLGLAGVFEGALVARFLYLVLLRAPIGEASAYALGPTLAALALWGVGRWRRRPVLANVAAAYATLGTLAWLDRWLERLPALPWFGPWTILVTLATVVTAFSAMHSHRPTAATVWVASTLVWAHLSALGQHWLGPVGLGMSLPASVSTSWTATALVLLATGLAREVAELRYAALLLLGVTAGKIVLLDLAMIDQAIKVVVMLFLGLVMLGGGYWYIRRERSRPRAPSTAPDEASNV
ncbi:MAG: DUF2339 domain-containing protein [Fimbriimonadaceae bacterium]|nr:DUF2339 domain-containing protein [Fimbriimonadaceae bacterium]